MATQSQQIARIKQPMLRDLYTEFILWTAMPHAEKIRLGLEWQQDFAAHHHVDESTLWRWKKRGDFEQRVDAILKMWSTDKTPDIVHAIYRTAVKGNPMSQMIWLQYFKHFNTKESEKANESKKAEYGVNDIRFLISTLPEPYKTKHYGYLRELIEDAQQLRHAGSLEDVTETVVEPANGVPGQTDNDAQDVPVKGANAMAGGYQISVCEDLERQASPRYYQGAQRWW